MSSTVASAEQKLFHLISKIGRRGNGMGHWGEGYTCHPATRGGGGVGDGGGGTDRHHDDHHRGRRTRVGAGSAMGVFTGVPFELIRFLLTSAAVYFAAVGFANTLIAVDARGQLIAARCPIPIPILLTHLAKANPVSFQIFALLNIIGFTFSSGAAVLVLVDKRKLKSKVMFIICSSIASLCMALSFTVLLLVYALALAGSIV